jgi:hypothetical protein
MKTQVIRVDLRERELTRRISNTKQKSYSPGYFQKFRVPKENEIYCVAEYVVRDTEYSHCFSRLTQNVPF